MQFVIEIKNLLTKSTNVFQHARRVNKIDVDVLVIVFRIIDDEKTISNVFFLRLF